MLAHWWSRSAKYKLASTFSLKQSAYHGANYHMLFLLPPAKQFYVITQDFMHHLNVLKTFPLVQFTIYIFFFLFFAILFNWKMPRMPSSVWKHFRPTKVDGKSLFICKYCAKAYVKNATKINKHIVKCSAYNRRKCSFKLVYDPYGLCFFKLSKMYS